jgi:hypothetical protein
MARHGDEKNSGDLLDRVLVVIFCNQAEILIAEGISQGKNESPTVFELL